MATTIAAPNLQRFTLPEIEFSYDSNGIIAVIDDLVERVMSRHMKIAALEVSEFSSPEESVVSLLSLHSAYDFSRGEEAAA